MRYCMADVSEGVNEYVLKVKIEYASLYLDYLQLIILQEFLHCNSFLLEYIV